MQDLLKADVEHADAMTLARYLGTRTAAEPLTLREALEAVHRRQGATINQFEAAHIHTVAARLQLAGVPVSIDSPTPPVDVDKAYAALERLPMLPLVRLR